MDNSQTTASSVPWKIIIGIVLTIIIVLWFILSKEENKSEIVNEVAVEEVIKEEPLPIPDVIEPEIIDEPLQQEVVEEDIVEPEALIPTLEESDAWLEEKLPTITWRKELLKLVIDDNMIRRLVVFTDNFSQGILAYEHSPLIKPITAFSGREINENGEVVIKWDKNSTRRFSLYVDLLRSVDSDVLVSWYYELKPLIDEAYRELGYPEEDFTDILQDAITKVLDMEIPKERLELTRPSVMYKYKNDDIESLDDADKLMLRLGKENLLVIKSVLLEINEKISRERD
jgi:hypothetical protein